MAFETILARQGEMPETPDGGRRLSLLLTVLAHGGLIAIAVVHSYWAVDEVKPPPLVIQVPLAGPAMTAAPTAGGGGGGGSRKEQRPQVRKARDEAKVPPAVATQPREEPTAAEVAPAADPVQRDQAEDDGAGAQGGDGLQGAGSGPGRGPGDGPGNGEGNGTGPDGPPGGGGFPKPVPPQVASKQCVSCPLPHLPPPVMRMGPQAMLLKICADASGAVTNVRILRGIGDTVDAPVVETIQSWRYDPYRVDGRAVPFCYVARFVFTPQ